MAHDDDATARLWALADLMTPMAIRVAATLHIADHIAAGRRSAPELAEATGTDADALARVLRHLGAAGVLSTDGAGHYSLTVRAEALLDGHPSHMRAKLDLKGAVGRADLSFSQLLHTVRSGAPAFPEQFHQPFWQDLAADEARSASFAAQMGADVSVWAPAISAAFDWGSFGHLIDVGGGDGTLMIALLSDHPTLRGTVVDQAHTAETAARALNAAGLADRADAVTGDFFDPLPPGADGYLLTAIIHDWDDKSARTILRRCADAAGPTGRVIVIEKIGSDGVTPNTEMDLRLLAYFGGRERTVDQLRELAAETGLTVLTVRRAGAIAVLELAVASSAQPAGAIRPPVHAPER